MKQFSADFSFLFDDDENNYSKESCDERNEDDNLEDPFVESESEYCRSGNENDESDTDEYFVPHN